MKWKIITTVSMLAFTLSACGAPKPDICDRNHPLFDQTQCSDRGDGVKPKPDEPKPDKPKPDEPKPDEPKPDEPKPDEPKPEPDEPKPDKPKPGDGKGKDKPKRPNNGKGNGGGDGVPGKSPHGDEDR